MWQENKMHGFGHLIWPNGRQYEGEFVNDVKQGEGTFQWADGQIYTGQWLNGKQHGKGVLTSLDGIPRVGLWENGKRLTWLKESELDMVEQSAEESKEGLGVVQEYSHSQS